MLEKREIDDADLSPALILSSAVVRTTPSMPSDSYPEGSCFFVAQKFVATARHCGEILREQLRRESVRAQGEAQPYGCHIFDPRFEITWKVKNERPMANADISILEVEAVIEPDEDASAFLPWTKIWENENDSRFPVIRMTKVENGEHLTLKGFTDIEYDCQELEDERGRLLHGASATGIIGSGKALWQECESASGITVRLTIDGVAAKGQNSGGPVVDEFGRLVGLVSLSPDDGYTVIHTFFNDEDTSALGPGVQLTNLRLSGADQKESTEFLVHCFWGEPAE